MTFDRDAASTDALLTDLYLDALLAGALLDDPGGDSPRLDPAARRAADRLRRDLVRVHPSFRFEERLATRLAEAAVAMRMPVAAGAEGRVVALRPLPGDTLDRDDPATDPVETAGRPGLDAARRNAGRPLLIGGALTSAALSIAGAAYVAWRRGRPLRGDPMARAARVVRAARPPSRRSGVLD